MTPQVAPTPPAPRVAPAAPSPAPSKASEPPESGWDDAAEISSSAVIPAAADARAAAEPPVADAPVAIAAAAPAAPPRAAAPAEAPADVVAGLPLEVQEQLFGVLRAALDASLLPLLEKQKVLEARLEWLNQAEQRAAAGAAAPAPRAQAVSLPFSLDVKPSEPAASDPPPSSTKASLVPTSYGFVIAPEGPIRRPSIELALENVGPIDVPDFGRGRRSAGNVLVALLVAGMFAAVAATILSYT